MRIENRPVSLRKKRDNFSFSPLGKLSKSKPKVLKRNFTWSEHVRICIFGSCHSEFTPSLQRTIIVLKENFFNMNPWDLRLSKQQWLSVSLSVRGGTHWDQDQTETSRRFRFTKWKHSFCSFVCISTVSRWSGRRWVRESSIKLPRD